MKRYTMLGLTAILLLAGGNFVYSKVSATNDTVNLETVQLDTLEATLTLAQSRSNRTDSLARKNLVSQDRHQKT